MHCAASDQLKLIPVKHLFHIDLSGHRDILHVPGHAQLALLIGAEGEDLGLIHRQQEGVRGAAAGTLYGNFQGQHLRHINSGCWILYAKFSVLVVSRDEYRALSYKNVSVRALVITNLYYYLYCGYSEKCALFPTIVIRVHFLNLFDFWLVSDG